jgi:hypothetical protein
MTSPFTSISISIKMKVDRNTAVKALKLHSNTIDAILYLGNK